MNITDAVLLVALWAAFSWLIGFVMRWQLSSFGVVDIPNARSSHNTPVVRGGGLGIMILLIGFALASSFYPGGGWALLGLIVVGAVSLIDDIKTLTISARLPVHLLGGALTAYGVIVSTEWEGSGMIKTILILVVSSMFLIIFINSYNFMDGVNGLAVMQSIVSGVAGALIVLRTNSEERELITFFLVLSAVSIGFLFHNFPKARMFLGDVGSVGIGIVIGCSILILWAEFGWRVGIVMVMVQLNFLLDTGATFLRRLLTGQRVVSAHREHFYQRLHRSGYTHKAVTGLEFFIQGVAIGVLICIQNAPLWIYCLGIFIVFVIWGSFFVWVDSKFQTFTSELTAPSSK